MPNPYEEIALQLLPALINQESGGKANAVSNKGAGGLMQLMPATAKRFGVENRFDPAQNVAGGTDYLVWLLKRYEGDPAKALAGYNAGEGAVDKYHGVPPYKETQNYVRSILGKMSYNDLKGLQQQGKPQEGELTPEQFAQDLEALRPGADLSPEQFAQDLEKLRKPEKEGAVARDTKEDSTRIDLSLSVPPPPTEDQRREKNLRAFRAANAAYEEEQRVKKLAQQSPMLLGQEEAQAGLEMLAPVVEKAGIEAVYGKDTVPTRERLGHFLTKDIIEEEAQARGEVPRERLPSVPSVLLPRTTPLQRDLIALENRYDVPYEMPLEGASSDVVAHYKRANEELRALAAASDLRQRAIIKQGFAGQVASGISQNAPRMIGPVATAIALSPAGPLAQTIGAGGMSLILNSDIATRAYAEARRKEVSPTGALGLALGEQLSETIPDTVTAGVAVAKGPGAVAKLFRAAGAGALSEPLSEVLGQKLEDKVYSEDTPLNTIVPQLAVSAVVGAFLGGSGGGLSASVDAYRAMQQETATLRQQLNLDVRANAAQVRDAAQAAVLEETLAQTPPPSQTGGVVAPAEPPSPEMALVQELAQMNDEEVLQHVLTQAQAAEAVEAPVAQEEVADISETATVEERVAQQLDLFGETPSLVEEEVAQIEEIEATTTPETTYLADMLQEILTGVEEVSPESRDEAAQVLDDIGASQNIQVATHIQEAVDNEQIVTEAKLLGITKDMVLHPELWDEQAQKVIFPATGNPNKLQKIDEYTVFEHASAALSEKFPQTSVPFKLLAKWWGPAIPEAMNLAGDNVFKHKLPVFVDYYKEVQALLETLFPDKSAVLVYYGHQQGEKPWHVKKGKNGKPTYDQEYGNGSLLLDQAVKFAEDSGWIALVSVPKANIYSLGQSIPPEHEVLYQLEGAYVLGKIPVTKLYRFRGKGAALESSTVSPTEPQEQLDLSGIPPKGLAVGFGAAQEEVTEEENLEAATEIPILDIFSNHLTQFQDYFTKNWKKAKTVGGQLGSQPGEVQLLPNGQTIYTKFVDPEKKHRAWNEYLANRLYAALNLGTPVMAAHVSGGKAGKIRLATIWEVFQKGTLSKEVFEGLPLVAKKDIWHGFAADAWLANWDVIGPANENVQITKGGQALRVDAGGALFYRAGGQEKTAFTGTVTELESMKDPHAGGGNNPSAAYVFQAMPAEEELFGAKLVANLNDGYIARLVEQTGLKFKIPKKQRGEMLKVLLERKAYIEQYYKTWTLPGVNQTAKVNGAAVALASYSQVEKLEAGSLDKAYEAYALLALEQADQLASAGFLPATGGSESLYDTFYKEGPKAVFKKIVAYKANASSTSDVGQTAFEIAKVHPPTASYLASLTDKDQKGEQDLYIENYIQNAKTLIQTLGSYGDDTDAIGAKALQDALATISPKPIFEAFVGYSKDPYASSPAAVVAKKVVKLMPIDPAFLTPGGGTFYSFPGPLIQVAADVIGKFWKKSHSTKVIKIGGVNAQAATLLKRVGVYSSNEEREMALAMDRYHARSKIMFWLNKLGLNRVGQGEVGVPLNTLTLLDWNWHIPGIPEYASALDRLHITHMQKLHEWDTLVSELNQSKEVEKIGDYLDAIAGLEFLKPGEAVRQPTLQEKRDLAKKYGIAGETNQAGAYTPSPAEVLAEKVIAQYAKALEEVREVWTADAKRLHAGPTQQAALAVRLKEINEQIDALLQVPYSPSYRDGEWGLTIKDAAGVPVDFSAYGSKKEAERAAKQLRESTYHSQGYYATIDIIPQEFRRYSGMPRHVLENMQGKLNLTPDQKDMFSAMLMNSLPHKAYLHRFRPKRRIPGYTKDVVMQLARYGQAHSNYVAKATYGWQLGAALQIMKNSVKDIGKLGKVRSKPIVTEKRTRIILNLTALHDEIMNPRDNYNGLKGFVGFFWYLSDISRAVIEPLVVPMVAWRNLSRVFGSVGLKVGGQLAAEDAKMSFGGRRRLGNTPAGRAKERAIQRAEKENLLGEAFAIQLAGFAEGNTLDALLAGTPVSKAWRRMLWASSWWMREGERAARRLTFNTTYELTSKALQKGDTSKQFTDWVEWVKSRHAAEIKDILLQGWLPHEAVAYAAAKEMVQKTSGEYAGWNKPRSITSSAVMDLAFTGLNYFFQQWRRVTPHSHRPYKAATYDDNGDLVIKEFENPMQKAAMDNLLIQLVVAGIMGLPFAPWLVDILDALFYAMKVQGHTSVQLGNSTLQVPTGGVKGLLRSWFAGFDPDLPDFALHGLSYHTFGMHTVAARMGYGDYMPDLDLSRQLGMGAGFPLDVGKVVKSFAIRDDVNGGDLVDNIMEGSFGLPYTLLRNINKALINDSPVGLGEMWSNPSEWSHAHGGLVPKSVRSMLEASGAFQSGEERLSPTQALAVDGQAIKWDRSNPGDMATLAFRALGFTPTKISEAYEQQDDTRLASAWWATRKSLLLQTRDMSLLRQEGLEDYLKAKVNYNAMVPFSAMRITAEEETSHFNAFMKRRIMGETGLPPNAPGGEAKLPLYLKSLIDSGHLEGIKTESLKIRE